VKAFLWGASMPDAVRHQHAALSLCNRFRRGRIKLPVVLGNRPPGPNQAGRPPELRIIERVTDGMHPAADVQFDASDLTPYLAGRIGQATIDRLGGYAHPELDQHVAAVTDTAAAVLGAQRDDPDQLLAFLVQYASGFVAAATGGGWQSPGADERLDWESMRLAAVCRLVTSLSERSENADRFL
jgi:Family of unknown function (DUF6401)